LLFPIAMATSLSWFADDLVDAVERRYYPDLPTPQGTGIARSTLASIRFILVAIVLNLLVLPLYLLPVANVIVYLSLNGYLLGREYLELVAQRRLDFRTIAVVRRVARTRLWWAGVWIAAILMIPVVNLIAPVIATCFMVHVFERLRRQGSAVAAQPGLG
ncbi:MAG: EI24 domain-containing protein, partial [Pseudomonadota bacterium]